MVEIPAQDIRKWVSDLLKSGKFVVLSTITGYQEGDKIFLLYHFATKDGMVDVRSSVPLAGPKIDSISNVLPGAILYEREIHDILGVSFEGIPDNRRLILPEDWPDGVYPLRKDYPATRGEK